MWWPHERCTGNPDGIPAAERGFVLTRTEIASVILVACLAAGTSHAGQPPVPSHAEVQASLQLANRFFDGYRFVQAKAICDRLLEQSLIDTETLETALYLQARCMLELAQGSGHELDQAIEKLAIVADNRLEFEKPIHDKNARFWIGRAYLKAGKPALAVQHFKRITDLGEKVELDAQSRWYLAQALQAQAAQIQAREPQEEPAIARQRDQLRQEAITRLLEISFTYPNSPFYQDAELALIHLRMDLREYPEAAKRADDFLRHEGISPRHYAETLLCRAQCAYWTGELLAAIQFYEKLLQADGLTPAVQLDALHGLGWSLSRVARTAGREQSVQYYTRARRRLERAYQCMPEPDSRRPTTLHTLCEVLVELGLHKEALEQLDPLLADPGWKDRAHYLAGLACRGLQQYAEAVDHFEQALHLVRPRGTSDLLMEILHHLAELESERGMYAAALYYCREVGQHARALRDHAAVAESELGVARAMIGLGQPDPLRHRLAAQSLLQALLRILPSGATSPPPGLADEEVRFRLACLQQWSAAGPRNYERALDALTLLRQRYQDRVRADELAFEEGQALFLQAEYAGRSHLAEGALTEKQIQAVFHTYEAAAEHMQDSLHANPRGHWAPKASCTLGRIFAAKGRFAFQVARMFDPQEGRPYRDEGKKMLEWALPPFRDAIKTAGPDTRLRLQSHHELGRTYYDLEEFAQAEQEFETLVGDPDLDEVSRIAATRDWADALDRLGRSDEAVLRLGPDIGKDLASTILAGIFLEKLQRPQDAYRTYRSGLSAEAATEPDEQARAAEVQYRAYALALSQAQGIVAPGEVTALQATAVENLQQLIRNHPDTPWAATALLSLGDYLLNRPEGWRQALQTARDALTNSTDRNRPAVLQAGHILAGRALLSGGQSEAAAEAFDKALQIDLPTETGRSRHATAMRERGNAARALRRYNDALDYYGRVFVSFHQITAEADLARIASAEIYLQLSRQAQAQARQTTNTDLAQQHRTDAAAYLERAFDTLVQGHDRQAMLDCRQRLERAIKESP